MLGDAFRVLEFPDSTHSSAEAAAAIGCQVAQIAKSMLFRAADGTPVLVVASGTNRIDEKKVAALLGQKISRADSGFVQDRTGFAVGGVPPVGHATPPVTFDARIYEAAAADLLAVIREVPPATGTLLLIGHNPAIEDLALMLAAPPGATGPEAASAGYLERMRAKFPTAAVAVLQPTGTWRGLAQGRARLTAFVTPHDI